jgi:hypothetical protein
LTGEAGVNGFEREKVPWLGYEGDRPGPSFQVVEQVSAIKKANKKAKKDAGEGERRGKRRETTAVRQTKYARP